MRPGLEQLRDKQFGVFTTRQVLCEYTGAELRARIDRGQWVRVFQGVYREATTPPGPELRVEAARLSIGLVSLAAAYNTAAELHGFAVLAGQPTDVLGVQASRSARLVVHRDRVDPAELALVRGTVVTNAVRTAADLARVLTRLDALATLDAALRSGISRTAIADEIDKHTGRRGRRQAAELIELADGRAESPMESRARLCCIDAGLPPPEPQLEVPTRDGLRRIDLGWRHWRIGLEYDSAAWHSGPNAAMRDNPRHNWLTTEGWTIYYATAADVYHHPHHFTAPIRCAIDRAQRNRGSEAHLSRHSTPLGYQNVTR
ncbi:type IV toxin-antitoxin system AbiEi family antitoxin domain-containing protein [Nocardia pneumoniae]|uniref:type IV toxin-antitoxin system AbiEi family antitoxin domain-containing protein n=1 Tax=Nocardia pneumoniae TaxID=228601 RepID=UPI0006844FD0|nr:type IV toxin-antitoxin system AbiEi family antitoxin domain-containing protein [Nocardia pneumoniae]